MGTFRHVSVGCKGQFLTGGADSAPYVCDSWDLFQILLFSDYRPPFDGCCDAFIGYNVWATHGWQPAVLRIHLPPAPVSRHGRRCSPVIPSAARRTHAAKKTQNAGDGL